MIHFGWFRLGTYKFLDLLPPSRSAGPAPGPKALALLFGSGTGSWPRPVATARWQQIKKFVCTQAKHSKVYHNYSQSPTVARLKWYAPDLSSCNGINILFCGSGTASLICFLQQQIFNNPFSREHGQTIVVATSTGSTLIKISPSENGNIDKIFVIRV